MDQSIIDLGFPYAIERYPAITGDDRAAGITPGELGCFLSHKDIIDNADDDKIVLIFEDDVEFSPKLSSKYDWLVSRLSREEWDIAFLGQIVDYEDVLSLKKIISAKKSLGDIQNKRFNDFRIISDKSIYKWGTFAYLINPASLSKIRGFLSQSAANGYKRAIDNTYRALIRSNAIEARIVFPYLAGLHTDLPTTMPERNGVNMALHSTMTNLFVAGRSQSDAKIEAAKYIRHSEIDHDAIIACRVIYERLKQ